MKVKVINSLVWMEILIQYPSKNGGISGLGQLNFDKSSIYSINADGDTDGNYKVYVVYNNDYQGLIMFPNDDTIAGNIVLKKVSDNSKVEGLIDIDRANRDIPQDYKTTWELTSKTDPSSKLTLTIDDTFVSLTGLSKDKKIPSSFFVNNNGTVTALGDFYGGTQMSISSDSSLTLKLSEASSDWSITIDNGKIMNFSYSAISSDMTFSSFTKQQ